MVIFVLHSGADRPALLHISLRSTGKLQGGKEEESSSVLAPPRALQFGKHCGLECTLPKMPPSRGVMSHRHPQGDQKPHERNVDGQVPESSEHPRSPATASGCAACSAGALTKTSSQGEPTLHLPTRGPWLRTVSALRKRCLFLKTVSLSSALRRERFLQFLRQEEVAF